VDWGSVCSAMDVVRSGEKRAESEGKAVIYQSIYVPALTYGHKLLSRDRKDETAHTSGRNKLPLKGRWAHL